MLYYSLGEWKSVESLWGSLRNAQGVGGSFFQGGAKIQWPLFSIRVTLLSSVVHSQGVARFHPQGVVGKELLEAFWTVFCPLSRLFGSLLVVKSFPRGLLDRLWPSVGVLWEDLGSQEAPKRLPRRLQEATKAPKTPWRGPKSPKSTPRHLQDAPRRSREHPKRPRQSPETLPRGPLQRLLWWCWATFVRSSGAQATLWRCSGDAMATLWLLATLYPRSSYALSMLQRLTKLWQRSGHALTLERRSYTLPRALKLLSL